ncbi:MAG TPA: hypothetical protein VEA81_07070 [Burkholderiaceae bacterium]|nr:hypothetical protein [Burkholderiaceae bacterium]
MYRVFWMEADEPRSEGFPGDALTRALAFAEAQRRRRREGEPVSFVVLASEDPHSIGESGVADPSPGYDWTKRRRPRGSAPGRT